MAKYGTKIKVTIIGLIFVALGGLLLAGNLGYLSFDIKEYIFKWQTLLIIIGLLSLTKREGIGVGVVLIIIGGFFYLRNFIDFPVGFHQVFWPVLIICIGLFIIFSRLIFRHRLYSSRGEIPEDKYDDEYIDDVTIFGGVERTLTSQNFRGGKAVSLFGGSKINLLNAKLAPGTQYIEIIALFGGTQYIIPKDWNIKINIISIFGGFADKRLISENDIDPSKKLIIKGIVIFGGGEIKSFNT